jgi:hypothetical protein
MVSRQALLHQLQKGLELLMVRKLPEQKIAMVGDGVKDAPVNG